jgi:hypothetical protein
VNPLSDPALHCAHPVLQRGLTSAHPAALNSLGYNLVWNRPDPKKSKKNNAEQAAA